MITAGCVRGTIVAALLLLSGCYQHAYVVSGTTPEEHAADSQWRHYLFNGLVDLSDDLDLRAICPQGVSRVENGMAWYNAIFYLLSATIYTSTMSRVFCHQDVVSAAAVATSSSGTSDAR